MVEWSFFSFSAQKDEIQVHTIVAFLRSSSTCEMRFAELSSTFQNRCQTMPGGDHVGPRLCFGIVVSRSESPTSRVEWYCLRGGICRLLYSSKSGFSRLAEPS